MVLGVSGGMKGRIAVYMWENIFPDFTPFCFRGGFFRSACSEGVFHLGERFETPEALVCPV